MNEDRLELGAEEQVFTASRNVQRLDPDPVACQHQSTGGGSPKSHGEHAAHSLKGSPVPLQKRVQNGFSVAMRLKAVAQALKFAPNFQVIVDLAVEGDRC